MEAHKCPKHYVYSAFGENVVFGSGGRMLNLGKAGTPPPDPQIKRHRRTRSNMSKIVIFVDFVDFC